jgi:hypothetical protein
MSNLLTSDLIRRTRDHCQGGSAQVINTLALEKSPSVVTATLAYPIIGTQVGQTVEIGLVEYSVVALDSSAKTLDLLPMVEGTAVSHSAGSRVTFSPRFPARRIIDELNTELNGLTAEGIYRLVPVSAVDGVITPPEGALVLLDAWSDSTDAEELHRYPVHRWQLGDDPDGVRLVGPQDAEFMVFGCTLGELPYTVDIDVSLTGLVNTAEDIPPLGAAIVLLAGREAQRNLTDTQGNTRRAEEVPPGAITGALRTLAGIRQDRINAEVRRFQQRYGLKLHAAV